MAKQDRLLAIDIGSTGVRLSEFEPVGDSVLILHHFKNVEYPEALSESNRTEVIAQALTEAREDSNFTTNRAAVCVSGQAAFMRFVKLPPVAEEEARIKQIVEYEAKQNVPFPMDEVIWDYQLFTTGEGDEDLEVMFVVIKNEIVEGVIEAVRSVGLKPVMVDFAPAALYNVARANHVGDNECAMVLNIGGRCTTLLFLDGQRFFARTIPIAGFSITQQIAKEFGINNDEAEILKRRHGFVALGGAYEEPESEVAATISKIVRNVMTRLHGEINRSISVYRTQQKGKKPTHLYLAGGSSTMAFTDHFFSEKLRMEVSYLNPFKIVSLDESLDIKQLEELAHRFPEVVGVGLRRFHECPVEVSLVPESEKKRQSFLNKQPYIMASCGAWLTILFVFIMVTTRTSSLYQTTAEKKKANVERLTKIENEIKGHNKEIDAIRGKHDQFEKLLERRYEWSDFYNALQVAKPQDVWLIAIEQLSGPITTGAAPAKAAQQQVAPEEAGLPFLPVKRQKKAAKSTKKKATKDEVYWFKLVGRCVLIPSTEPSRPIFTPEQIRALYKDVLEPPEPAEGEEPLDYDPAELMEAIEKANVVKADVRLPEIFLQALQRSEFFSGDPKETRILSFDFDQTYQNLESFEIQLKLAEPINLKR